MDGVRQLTHDCDGIKTAMFVADWQARKVAQMLPLNACEL